MKILFMGTPEFALPSLEQLHASKHSIQAVVTGEDKPRGRGHRLQPTPVARLAEKLSLPILKVTSLKDEETVARLEAFGADAIVLVAFGYIIPPRLLAAPPQGCINLHPSLLPAYRGASPIHAPLLAGDEVTGVSTMYMDEGLDTGDIIMQEEVQIPSTANAGYMHDLLAQKGARLLVKTLDLIEKGEAPRIVQNDARASYAPKVSKELIHWTNTAEDIVRRIRGLSPFPGVHSMWQGKQCKIINARSVTHTGSGEPGEIVGFAEDGPVVACGSGHVLLTQLQLAGGNVLSGLEFINGIRPTPGEKFA